MNRRQAPSSNTRATALCLLPVLRHQHLFEAHATAFPTSFSSPPICIIHTTLFIQSATAPSTNIPIVTFNGTA